MPDTSAFDLPIHDYVVVGVFFSAVSCFFFFRTYVLLLFFVWRVVLWYQVRWAFICLDLAYMGHDHERRNHR